MLAIDDIIKQPDDLFTGALEAVRRLHDARLEAGVAAMTLADLERRLRIEQAAAEIRAIQEAGGDEKALGSNAEARARALAVAVDKDPQYRAALDAVHEAYLRKVAADAVAEAAVVAAAGAGRPPHLRPVTRLTLWGRGCPQRAAAPPTRRCKMDPTDTLNTLTDISLHLQSIADSLGRNDAAEALASVDASLANISGSLESIADSLERLDKAAWALIALLERVEALLADRN